MKQAFICALCLLASGRFSYGAIQNSCVAIFNSDNSSATPEYVWQRLEMDPNQPIYLGADRPLFVEEFLPGSKRLLEELIKKQMPGLEKVRLVKEIIKKGLGELVSTEELEVIAPALLSAAQSPEFKSIEDTVEYLRDTFFETGSVIRNNIDLDFDNAVVVTNPAAVSRVGLHFFRFGILTNIAGQLWMLSPWGKLRIKIGPTDREFELALNKITGIPVMISGKIDDDLSIKLSSVRRVRPSEISSKNKSQYFNRFYF